MKNFVIVKNKMQKYFKTTYFIPHYFSNDTWSYNTWSVDISDANRYKTRCDAARTIRSKKLRNVYIRELPENDRKTMRKKTKSKCRGKL
jgi:hypothetical protein